MYIYFALAFVWYSLILLFVVEFFGKTDYKIDETIPYSIILAVYNENPNVLSKCIESLVKNIGNKEIIIADDGSTLIDTKRTIKKYAKLYPEIIKPIFLEKNKGKKFAQVVATKKARNQYCVTVDSDTIYKSDSLIRLISPLEYDKNIGLTNGNVEILNSKENLITKTQQLQNYGAFMIGRKSLGGLGIMNCASGIAIGYRRDYFLRMSVEYLDKRPFGFDCKFGEDRFLTNITLRENKKVVFIEESLAYTLVPNTLAKFLKQQLRWKISGIIEGIHVISFSWKTNIILFAHSIFNLLLPFMCISMIITLVLSNLILRDYFSLITFVAVIITATFVRDIIILLERKDLIKWVIPYSFLNLFGLIWLWIIALFRIDEQSWITR